MKSYFLKLAGAAAVLAFVSTSALAQQDKKDLAEKKDRHKQNEDLIIIKPKANKDTKLTIEIKDGEVKVNGKPLSEFKDDNVSVSKRKQLTIENRDMTALDLPGAPQSRFRGGALNFGGDQMFGMDGENSNRPFLGVNTEKVEAGAKITALSEKSAAEKAGLKVGDVITKINDEKISNQEELSKAVRKFKPEEKITVTFIRDGKEQKVTATLGKRSVMVPFTLPQGNFNFKDFNLDKAPFDNGYGFNLNSRGKLGLKAQEMDEGKGLKVLDVDDESPADKAGIKEGDIITEFDGAEVNNIDKLRELAKAAMSKTSFKVKITRDGKQEEVEVKIPKNLKTTNL